MMNNVKNGSIALLVSTGALVLIFAYWMTFDQERYVTDRIEHEMTTDREDTIAGNLLLLRAEALWDKGMYEEAKVDWNKAKEVIPSHVDMNAAEPKALGWPPAGWNDAKRVHTYPYYDEVKLDGYDLRGKWYLKKTFLDDVGPRMLTIYGLIIFHVAGWLTFAFSRMEQTESGGLGALE